ncbi:alpha/beta hydrolase family domain-containing protein [Rhizoctonia solani AG-1 IA]|uniref:Alpha/beta hydrolase family domain-containing protein n=1 Tax=Thanatephorus cucumeris (strain AG1-IA) TaxID=983506 RepID=L8WR23_THACA|nr:alpha/beta hydrolase family domain-containing protein [Rhizoctonia solani AG-1 IA]
MAILPYSLHLDRIVAHIHVHPALSDASRIAVLFILHGHPASAHHMKPIVGGTFDLAKNKAALLEDLEDDSDFSNAVGELEYESTQLYNKQGGPFWIFAYNQGANRNTPLIERIASAVSELIDTLPAVLCPNNDRFIDTWMVAGLSLGAHAAWLSMDRGKYDKKVQLRELNIGSPDFLEIATARNNLTGLPLVSSYMTSVTRNHILKNDPVSCRRNSLRPDPFMNKHILALAGAQDGMIPFTATRQFLDRINVGPIGTKRLIIQQGVGHQCTREMVIEMAELVWAVALS